MEETKTKRTRRKKRSKEAKPGVEAEVKEPVLDAAEETNEQEEESNKKETNIEQKEEPKESKPAKDTIEILEEQIITEVTEEITVEVEAEKEEKDDSKKRFNFGTKLKSLNPLKKFTKDKKKSFEEGGNESIDLEDGVKNTASDKEDNKEDDDINDHKRNKGKFLYSK